jgi:CBS domain-containing protein
MRVAQAMTPNVEIANPDDTIEHAAQLMAQLDVGALPVGENDHLIGMLTDRDITIRVAAMGKAPSHTRVRDAMTAEIRYCFEDEDLDHVARNMGDQQVRRLPVVTRDKRLVGILSLGDIALQSGGERAGEAVGVCRGRADNTISQTWPTPRKSQIRLDRTARLGARIGTLEFAGLRREIEQHARAMRR